MKSTALLLVLVGTVTATGAAQAQDTVPLSLETAVDRALRAGDEVLLARAQVELAEAQLTTARASALPQLRISGAYTHVMENARAQAVGQIFNQPNTYTSSANLSHSIFQGGRSLGGLRAASRLRSAARLTAQEARNNASFGVQRAYLQALFAQQLAEIQGANLELAEAQLKQVMQFESAGRAARYDVLRARVQRANIEPQFIQARGGYEIAVLELKRLSNIPAEQPIALTTRLAPESVQQMVRLAGMQESSVDDRPSVRAAALIAAARHSAISVARADLLPTVNVFIQSGFQAFPLNGFPNQRGALEPVPCAPGSTQTNCTRQNGGWFSDRSLGVQVSWPIFDGLRAKGNIDAAQAQAKIADLQLAQEREAVALEIEQARANFEAARALFAARQQNEAEANEAFRLASLRFTRGLSTQLDISDAQIALLTARTNEARSVYDLYLALAELARAQGKPIPLPPTPARELRTGTENSR
ncbi:MAG: TolC family protein [Gemmatimonadota bacterium]